MYTNLRDAEADFYEQVGKDMKNAKLGGSLNFVVNSEGGYYDELNHKWGFMSEEERPSDEVVTEE